MIKIESYWVDLRQLDELASNKTIIHCIHPCIKLLTTITFLTVVASFSKYEVASLLPLCLYPMVLIMAGNLPFKLIGKRVLLALPFVLFVGIFNPILDQTPILEFGTIFIAGGWVSLTSILLRFFLAVTAALILVATTGMDKISMALLRLRVPRVFVIQLLFMYRYLYVLIDEFIRAVRAYSLRSFHREGIGIKVWGTLLGQLLLRTIDRGGRIYQAMLCRGFDGQIRLGEQYKLVGNDIIYFFAWSAFFALVRFVNIPQWIGSLLIGGK